MEKENCEKHFHFLERFKRNIKSSFFLYAPEKLGQCEKRGREWGGGDVGDGCEQ